jgi:hypothetical protein
MKTSSGQLKRESINWLPAIFLRGRNGQRRQAGVVGQKTSVSSKFMRVTCGCSKPGIS